MSAIISAMGEARAGVRGGPSRLPSSLPGSEESEPADAGADSSGPSGVWFGWRTAFLSLEDVAPSAFFPSHHRSLIVVRSQVLPGRTSPNEAPAGGLHCFGVGSRPRRLVYQAHKKAETDDRKPSLGQSLARCARRSHRPRSVGPRHLLAAGDEAAEG